MRMLLDALGGLGIDKPLFLKVAPFASTADLETFLAAVEPARFVSGFAVNLPSGKPDGLLTPPATLARMPGAVSGQPAAAAAERTIRELYGRMDRARYLHHRLGRRVHRRRRVSQHPARRDARATDDGAGV